jgi:Tol biopolymer transport system component
MKRILGCLVVTCLALAATLVAQQSRPQDVDLQAAIRTETVDGNLRRAIELYAALAAAYESADRAVAAEALSRMGDLHQKLGDSQKAREVWQRLTTRFNDQAAIAAQARARLAMMASATAVPSAVARRVPIEGAFNYASLSRDGRFLAATGRVSNGAPVIVDMSRGDITLLPGEPGDNSRDPAVERTIYGPVVSEDGRQVAYTWAEERGDQTRSELRVLSNEPTATPRTVLRPSSEITTVWPWAWSSDHRAILTEIERPDRTWLLAWVSAADGVIQVVKSLEWRRHRPRDRMRVSLSPDGRYIAYGALVTNPRAPDRTAEDPSDTHVFVLASDGSSEIEITTVPGVQESPVFSADGSHLMILSTTPASSDLWAVPIRDGRPSGEPFLAKTGLSGRPVLGMTQSGSYYFQEPGSPAGQLRLAQWDGHEKVLTLSSAPILGYQPRWSPTNDQVAFMRSDSTPEIIVRSTANGVEKTYPAPPGSVAALAGAGWFPDGKHLLVVVHRKSGSARESLAVLRGVVPGAQRLSFAKLSLETGRFTDIVTFGNATFTVPVLSRDGTTLYAAVRTGTRETGGRILWDSPFGQVVAVTLATGDRRLVVIPNGRPVDLALSPDGKTLAIRSASPSGGIETVDTDGRNHRLVVAHETIDRSAGSLQWSSDGRSLLWSYLPTGASDGTVVRVWAATGRREPTPLRIEGGGEASFSPDGSRVILGGRIGTDPQLWTIDNLLAGLPR